MSRTEHILTLTEVIAAVSSAELRARGTAALKAIVESSLDVSPGPGARAPSKAALRAKSYRQRHAQRDAEAFASRVERDGERDANAGASRSERDANGPPSRPVTVGVTPPAPSLSALSLDLEIEKTTENTGDQRERPTRALAREAVTERDEGAFASRSVTAGVTPFVTPLGSPCAVAVHAEIERVMGLETLDPAGRRFLAGLDRVRLARELALIADKSPVSLAVQVAEELCKAAVVSLPSADPWNHERVHERARSFVMSAERKRRQETAKRPGDVRAMGRQEQRDPAKTKWMQEPKEAK